MNPKSIDQILEELRLSEDVTFVTSKMGDVVWSHIEEAMRSAIASAILHAAEEAAVVTNGDKKTIWEYQGNLRAYADNLLNTSKPGV